MLEDEWATTGTHEFTDCWCGHTEANPLNGKTLDVLIDRVHRWVALACPEDCDRQSRVHGHVHIHCPRCAGSASGCC